MINIVRFDSPPSKNRTYLSILPNLEFKLSYLGISLNVPFSLLEKREIKINGKISTERQNQHLVFGSCVPGITYVRLY